MNRLLRNALTAALGVAPPAACATAPAAQAPAIFEARVSACPAGRMQETARTSGETTGGGVEAADVSVAPLGGEGIEGKSLRWRRIVVQPGGIVSWHSHAGRPGIVMLVSGEMTEYRSDCLDPIVHRAGDVVNEAGGISHWWRNDGPAPAILFGAAVTPDQ